MRSIRRLRRRGEPRRAPAACHLRGQCGGMRGVRAPSLILGILIAVCLAPSSHGSRPAAASAHDSAQAQAVPLAPERLQGCYKLKMSAWRPDLHLGGDSAYITPPRAIQLFAEQGTKSIETNGYVLRPAPGARPSIHKASYWRIQGLDSIELVWSTGFSGLTMLLQPQGQDLRGKAKTSWDFNRTEQTAEVLAQRITCATH